MGFSWRTSREANIWVCQHDDELGTLLPYLKPDVSHTSARSRRLVGCRTSARHGEFRPHRPRGCRLWVPQPSFASRRRATKHSSDNGVCLRSN